MTNPRIAVIGIPGKWSTEVLAERIAAKIGACPVIDMAEVTFQSSAGALTAHGLNLNEFDGLVVKKISQQYSPSTVDRLELLRVAEAQGVRVFSPASSMLRLIDRLSCTVTLQNHSIPMPDTCVTESISDAIAFIQGAGEVVLKPLFSTKARGMTVLDASESDDQLSVALTSFQQDNPVLYLQRKIALSGRDMGLMFLGGKYLGAYARVAQTGAWNTTIHSGGKYEAVDPDASVIAMAFRAQELFQMDFTTVDVAETDDGPICFEVSAFGGFRGGLEGTGIDVAEHYAQYVLGSLS
ncbi:MAG: GAK system ATP-grasp enzyme [Gammaproteobacteria bacterium]|nr:GAK system ATP-grasp enzyme [Gammaproteobacteria bacterium]